jgi:hypothetical protein
MRALVPFFLIFGFCVVLPFGLWSVLRDLMQRIAPDDPAIGTQAPSRRDVEIEPPGARSQFAWQSRSHFRAPD